MAENPTENVTVIRVVARNNIGGNGVGEGITTKGTVHNVNIEYCEAYHNTGNGITLGRITKTFHEDEEEGEFSAAHNCTIVNCLVYRNMHPDYPGNTDGTGGSHMHQCTISDNVVFENSDDGIDIYASTEMIVKSNIVFGHTYEGGNCAGIKFSAGGGGRHTIADNVVFKNTGISYEGSKPSLELVPYYPSKMIGNVSCGGYLGFGIDRNYVPAAGYEKTLLRNNIAVMGSSHDIYYGWPEWTDSDHNFFSNAADLATLQANGLDLSSLTGGSQLNDPNCLVDTTFGDEWSIERKLEYIRTQVRKAFSPLRGSVLADAGIVVAGYHESTPGDQTGEGAEWYGMAPDIGVYEMALSEITDLSVSSVGRNSVTMAWTVPGADGTMRRPTQYDIRYSFSPLDESSWDDGLQVLGEPVPAEPGETESFTISGLAPGSMYYVAIKTADELGNTSWLSNTVSGTTTSEGNYAPVLGCDW